MNEQDYEQLTLFREDSPANRFPLPGNEAARTMTVTSGRRCCELLKNSDRLGCLVRMLLESSVWHSTRCFLTWKTSGTPRKRLLFQLAVSMPRTEGTGSLLWPTPKASSPLGGCSGARKTLQRMAERGLITEQERKMFASGLGGKINPALLEWLMGYEHQFTKLMPTPVASDARTAATNRWYSQTVQVEREREPEREVPPSALRTLGMHSAWENWPDEPELDRVVDGIPHRMDRVKCLGNAVVPQQFYPFFDAIYKLNYKESEDGTNI